MNRRVQIFTVLAILIGSGVLRFYGMGWGTDLESGKFHRFHPDENTVISAAGLLGMGGKEIPYGKIPVYVLATAARGFGGLVGIQPFVDGNNESTRFTYQVARGLSATLGMLTVGIVFLIGFRVSGWETGCWAALFLGFCASHIQQSHYYAVDVTFGFFATLAMYFMIQLPSHRKRLYLGCGVACGLAAGTRLVGVVLVIPFLLVHLWGSSSSIRDVQWRRLLQPNIWLCGILGFPF